MENKVKDLEYLMTNYPENLTDTHKCYWWTVLSSGSNVESYPPTYYLLLKENDKVILRANSYSIEDLEKLLIDNIGEGKK